MQQPPRYVAGRRFPAHAFIPGRSPRPQAAEPAQAMSPLHAHDWQEHVAYLWGVDLFNHGYPWEAHEAWEGTWQIAEPGSLPRALLQGLIQCAAAVVKALAGQPGGAARLGRRGLAHLEAVLEAAGSPYMGVDLGSWIPAFCGYVEAARLEPENWPRIELMPQRAAS